MRIEEPDFGKLTEAKIQFDNYSGNPDKWVIYEQDDNGVYFPSFARCGKYVINPGVKLTIEVVENGYLIRSGKKSYIVDDNNWELERTIKKITKKVIEKERELEEDEVEELTTMTLKINTHFAAQSKR